MHLCLSWAWQPLYEYHDKAMSPWSSQGGKVQRGSLSYTVLSLQAESSEQGSEEEPSIPSASSTPPQSRLARLAEDWLMEEEQDELVSYWQRFDEKTTTRADPASAAPSSSTTADESIVQSSLTTEERLERYLDSRGIRRKEEQLHQQEIETAIQLAQKATTPQEALLALEAVQPWLQVYTRLGGLALMEYIIAQWQSDPKWIDQEQELCQALLQNPHEIVVSKMRQLLKRPGPPPRQPSFWTGIFSSKDGSSSSGWW